MICNNKHPKTKVKCRLEKGHSGKHKYWTYLYEKVGEKEWY